MHGCTRKSAQAFTLVELLVVIVVLAILAAVVVPRFMGAGDRSREAALKSDLKVLRNAVSLFYADCGSFPAQLSDLAATSAPAKGKDKAGSDKNITAGDWNGPYVESVPNDPIAGAAFTYSVASGSVGKVTSSASGNGLDGTAYSSW